VRLEEEGGGQRMGLQQLGPRGTGMGFRRLQNSRATGDVDDLTAAMT
jgi:hypothetical protein